MTFQLECHVSLFKPIMGQKHLNERNDLFLLLVSVKLSVKKDAGQKMAQIQRPLFLASKGSQQKISRQIPSLSESCKG